MAVGSLPYPPRLALTAFDIRLNPSRDTHFPSYGRHPPLRPKPKRKLVRWIYCKSSKETRESYSSFEAPIAGLNRILVFLPIFLKFTGGLLQILFKGGSLLRIYGI